MNSGSSQIVLRNLEGSAQTYRALYDNFGKEKCNMRVTTNLVDSFAFVVEWGRTKIAAPPGMLTNLRAAASLP